MVYDKRLPERANKTETRGRLKRVCEELFMLSQNKAFYFVGDVGKHQILIGALVDGVEPTELYIHYLLSALEVVTETQTTSEENVESKQRQAGEAADTQPVFEEVTIAVWT